MDIIGQTITHYAVLDKLGEGGMGVVYRARDLSLDRIVALKFLPVNAGVSDEANLRFIQEARSAAALNHPNICTIHGIESQGDLRFIVMEYVEGRTLLEKRPERTVKQAVDIAVQIAEGLAAAHEKGIIHRDIKPDNIMVRKDGIVQIMDFGLARLRGATRLTREPAMTGTAGYMSPEQAQGLEVDHRSDIFSLGVVMYELFTGQAPFTGEHDAALAYQVVNVEPPPMRSIRADIGPAIERVVSECLQKDPDERYQSAREIARELKKVQRSSGRQPLSAVDRVVQPAEARRESDVQPAHAAIAGSGRIPWLVAGAAILTAVVLGLLYVTTPAADHQTFRAFLPPPDGRNFFMCGNEGGPAAISSDGRRLAFVAADSSGRRYLYVRSLDENTARRLEGTVGTIYPFWAPDNRTIGFFDENKMKRIDASGGAPQPICDVSNARGGTWSPDGRIVFSAGAATPLFVVPAAGGTPVQLSSFDLARGENSHRWPVMLPDGKHFLYFARTAASGTQSGGDAVFAASLDMKENKLLLHASSNALYASGYLLFARGTSLVAQQFDVNSLELKGEVQDVAEGVCYDESTLHSLFTASQNGVLVYQTGSVKLGSRLQFVDRNGKEVGSIGGRAEYLAPRFSPDGRKVVVDIYDFQAHNADLWIFDIVKGSQTRFTFSSAYEQYPLWSPGSDRVIFNANPEGQFNLYQKSSSGAGEEELIVKSSEPKIPLDCSPDGKLIMYQVYAGPQTQSDIWIAPLPGHDAKGKGSPVPFLQSASNEYDGRFSPDGRWVAYSSNESGRNEVYVRLLSGDAGSGRWQVSIAGGVGPRWRRDGKQLYYLSLDNAVMSADVTLNGAAADIANVHPLFEVPLVVHIVYPGYDVSPDGSRFLINIQYGTQNQSPLSLVVNWPATLRK